MNKEAFWSLIEQSKANPPQISSLIELIKKLHVDDIFSFETHLRELCYESHIAELWAAAYIIMDGCSNETFLHFRCWLIAQGKSVYQKSLIDPDHLATIIPSSFEITGETPELEELQHVSLDAYYLKRKNSIGYDENIENEFYDSLEQVYLQTRTTDIAIDWTDEEELKIKFPNLWNRFGDNPLS